jgi:glycosyltransferase involved in cell wall biosynthesis
VLLAVSRYQQQALCNQSGFPIEKTFILGNGVQIADYEEKFERKPFRLIYTSAPYRGLTSLLPIFKSAKNFFPELELRVFSGMSLYDGANRYQGPHADLIQQIKVHLREEKDVYFHEKYSPSNESIPGIHFFPPILQKDLAKEYSQAKVFTYPANVPETFCITAIEAQAAGCPVLSSTLGALTESVGTGGICVAGEPGSPEFLETYLKALVNILGYPTRWNELSLNGSSRVKEQFTWKCIAQKFIKNAG